LPACQKKRLIRAFSVGKGAPRESTVPAVSIIVPAYCEEGNIAKLYAEISQVLSSVKLCWKIIVVDDGSTDNTWREISKLHRRDPNVKD